jgi:hypothetical protein
MGVLMALLPLQSTDNKDLSILQTKWKAILDILLSNPVAGGIQVFYSPADIKNGTPGQFSFENPDGSLAVLNYSIPTTPLWAGNHNGSDYQTAVSSSMVDFAVVSGTPVFKETLNNGFSAVTSTLDGGNLPIPGIIFTPPSEGIYFLSASFNAQPLTGASQAAVQMTDGTNIYDSCSIYGSAIVNSNLILESYLEITAPASELTIKLQGAATAGRAYIPQKSNALNSDPSRVKWMIQKVSN